MCNVMTTQSVCNTSDWILESEGCDDITFVSAFAHALVKNAIFERPRLSAESVKPYASRRQPRNFKSTCRTAAVSVDGELNMRASISSLHDEQCAIKLRDSDSDINSSGITTLAVH